MEDEVELEHIDLKTGDDCPSEVLSLLQDE